MDSALEIDPIRIADFCLRWSVERLSLFGSALRPDFGRESDVDVLIRLPEGHPWSLFDWMQMIEELQSIFGRQVDLVDESSLRNPIRRAAILSSRKVVYGG